MMSVTHQLAVFREPLDRFTLPDRVIPFDIVERPAVQDEITAVDPSFAGFRLLVKLRNLISCKTDAPETGRRAHGGDGGQFSVRLVKFEQSRQIQIADAVAVGQHERLVLADPFLQTLNSTAGLGEQPGIDQSP